VVCSARGRRRRPSAERNAHPDPSGTGVAGHIDGPYLRYIEQRHGANAVDAAGEKTHYEIRDAIHGCYGLDGFLAALAIGFCQALRLCQDFSRVLERVQPTLFGFLSKRSAAR